MAQSQSQDSAIVSTDPSEASSSAAPVEAEIPLSQDSTQEESSEIMDKNDSRAHNTSEVRLVPECDEDDDVIIPLPDDENRIQR